MIDLGDTVQLPNDITAKVMGWQKMLGAEMEWCLQWWDGANTVEQWFNHEQLKAWQEDYQMEEDA